MKQIVIYLIVTFGVIACGKNNGDIRYLKIRNNSENRIILKCSTQFPDTSFVLQDLRIVAGIEAGAEESVISKNGWDNLVQKNESSTLIFFVFDSGIFSQYPDSIIEQEYMILKRYDLSLNELESMNWTIIYP